MPERVSDEVLKLLANFDDPSMGQQMARELLALRAECDGLRKDAERYRWLRKDCELPFGAPFIGRGYIGGISRWTERHADEIVDAAIDVAISRSAEAEPTGGSDERI